ncbi:MAG: hypothetical protein A2V65_03695 [Deltaproteobacteria bacterium RBG_13_49_15]|nr:MAG: hypothetical protein A2V65_03695 [Deltaproteobacteria bacterium RBG_13_49_15]
MTRLLIIIGVGYFCFRLLKMWVLRNRSNRRPFLNKGPDPIADVMIQDPFCRVYFPKRQGVHYQYKGKDLYFCSTSCRDRFLSERP